MILPNILWTIYKRGWGNTETKASNLCLLYLTGLVVCNSDRLSQEKRVEKKRENINYRKSILLPASVF